MLRRGMFLLGLMSLAVWGGQAKATTVSLDLLGAAPASTVNIGGTSVPTPEGAYAGVLDWQVHNGTTNYYTYCIDVSHNISTSGGPYQFTQVSLGTLLTNSDTLNGVMSLFSEHLTTPATSGSVGPAKIDTAADVAAISNENAAMFQVALWDLLYDYSKDIHGNVVFNGGALTATFYTGSQLSAADIVTAQGWALTAFSTTYSGNLNVQALESTGSPPGQNQALYLGMTSNTPATPLPSSAAGGLALLTALGAVRFGRSRMSM